MEKSFDEITVSSLSDLQLGGGGEGSATATVGSSPSALSIGTIGPLLGLGHQQHHQHRPQHQHQQQHQVTLQSSPSADLFDSTGTAIAPSASFLRETSQRRHTGNSSSNNSNNNHNLNNQNNSNNNNNGNSSSNENNLNRSSKSSFKQGQHLDIWLANAIRGLEHSNSQDSSDQLDSPTLKGTFGGDPLSLPPNLGYPELGLNSDIFSPTHQQQRSHNFSSPSGSGVNLPPTSHYLQSHLQYQQRPGYGGGANLLLNDGIEFASLPPRISHLTPSQLQQLQQQQQQILLGRRGVPGMQQNQNSSSYQDLLGGQRMMADAYTNDSSDNESKNSCAKSKLESAEGLLADLNLLNSGQHGNGGGGVGGNGNSGGPLIGNASAGIGAGPFNGTNSSGTGATNNSNNSNSNNNANNLVLVLLKEIGKLHETNKKICRNLHETKVEMEALKHSPHWGLSQRRDSISGLSTNSQPVGMRYNSFGLQSPAPTYHSQGNYTPGIVSDVVREIREVSRVREEALMDRMKTMIEERSWALNEANFRLLKETEDMKKSIQTVRSEMNQVVDRMLKLENEVINLKAQMNHHHQQQQQQNFVNLRERDSYGVGSAAGAKNLRRNSLHINYGRINNTDEFYGNNFNDLGADVRFANGNQLGSRKFGENSFGSPVPSLAGGQQLQHNGGGSGGLVVGGGLTSSEELHEDSSSNNDQVLLLERDALKLRRELQDALASKQESENRITALENIVSTLKEQVPPVAVVPVSSINHHHGGLGVTTNPAAVTSSSSSCGRRSSSPFYQFRTNNSSSPGGLGPGTQQPPTVAPGAISPKLQKAAQIQSLASPPTQSNSGSQHQQHHPFLHHLTTGSGTINVSGPVTDL
ncbi:putative uncharacterized protein DDB_G0286901 isoform X2 [Uranotaenia lowii]|uniref:putative uncharacterized protein DDB_G0286901 isoform X2 n=1 Tax=Uranotaenia lowii TaxID=190385 RepID=UPI00247A1DA3|nr:putative uncharacterized protein DDB_G0286901 isoform X2 [Uranotaenia lowii]